MGRIISHICPKHGYQQGSDCPECFEEHSTDAPYIKNDDRWILGWWEHIDKTPIYIESKKHLFHECEKRNMLPKAFMKPRSQGSGNELKRR